MANQKKKMRVAQGEFYVGRIGYIHTAPNDTGLVLFYPQEGIHPYCVWLKYEDLEELK